MEQDRSDFDAVVVLENGSFRDLLAVDERPVAAAEIFDVMHSLIGCDLGVLARDHVRIESDGTLWLTADNHWRRLNLIWSGLTTVK